MWNVKLIVVLICISLVTFELEHVLKFYLFYLFLAALGLRCCTRAFSSCVNGLLIAVASLVVEHGL